MYYYPLRMEFLITVLSARKVFREYAKSFLYLKKNNYHKKESKL